MSLAAIVLAGCATVPTGPDVAVMPGPGKTFEQFKRDDRVCRDHAERSLGTNPSQAGAASVAEGAGVGVGAPRGYCGSGSATVYAAALSLGALCAALIEVG